MLGGVEASTTSIPMHSQALSASVPRKCRHVGIIFMIGVCLFYSANTILAKVISVGAIQIGVFRVFLMYLLVIPILLRHGLKGIDDILGPRRIRPFLVLRGFSGASSGLLFYLAVKHTSPGTATCISFLDVVLVPIFSRIFLKEALTLVDIVFAVIAFIGVIFIARPQFLFLNSATDPESFIGILYALSGAVLSTCSYLFLRKIGDTVKNPLVPTFYFAFVGSAFYSVLVLITGDFEFPCLFQVGLLCLLALCGFAGVVLMTVALHTERPSTTSVINTSQIIFVTLFQVIFLHDMPSTFDIVGACMIFSTSICLGVRKIVNERRNLKS